MLSYHNIFAFIMNSAKCDPGSNFKHISAYMSFLHFKMTVVQIRYEKSQIAFWIARRKKNGLKTSENSDYKPAEES